jgi:hypothetical protein
MNTKRTPLAERFWTKVAKAGPDECWMWTGAKTPNGYGQINLGGRKGKRRAAHRVAYELCVGPIPDGHDLDHHCENKGCVNPAHLEPVTRQDNMLRFHGQRTLCKYGHPLDGMTHAKQPDGTPTQHRYCKTCGRESHRRWREQRRAA